jgi:tight adherence protein C
MSPAVWGGFVGALGGLGLVLVLSRAVTVRRADLAIRVLPYVRDVPSVSRRPVRRPEGPFRAVFGPLLTSAADAVERVLGGSASVRRRLERARLPLTVHDFRVEQVLWGLVALAATAVPALVLSLRSPGRTVPLLVLCAVAFAFGVLHREKRLGGEVNTRERAVKDVLPRME